MADEIIAITMKYRPVPTLNVVAETPEFPHGETTDNPSPVPNESRTKVSAPEAIPPRQHCGPGNSRCGRFDDVRLCCCR
jgi:hypothetical protein